MSGLPSPRPEIGLHPGSAAPATEEEIEWLLGQVPAVALYAEFDGCAIAVEGLVASANARALVRDACDAAFLARVTAALSALSRRAALEQNGGLVFVAAAFAHFLGEALPADRHPLLVAIVLRSRAHAEGRALTPLDLAIALDAYALET